MASYGMNSGEEDFSNFAAPVENAPMPRWQRKALEASQRPNCTPSGTPVKPKKTPRSRSNKRPKKTPSLDRFIPNRSAMDMDMCRLALNFESGQENVAAFKAALRPKPKEGEQPKSPDLQEAKRDAGYSSVLASSLLDIPYDPTANPADLIPKGKILAFKEKAPEAKEGYLNTNRVLYNQTAFGAGVRRNKFRHIMQNAERVLDAPGLLEDFYLNLLDWGSNNMIAVALDDAVYLWNGENGEISPLLETSADGDFITALAWMPDSNILAVGTNNAEIMLWDAEKMTCVRRMRSHDSRVCALAWNGPILTSGSRRGKIHNHDVRLPNHHVATLEGHDQEVCGLKWSPDGKQLASGGNDNLVCIWDYQESQTTWTPKHRFNHHSAAVKALSWCPWQVNVLATGGGTADRHLRFWNTSTGACLNAIDTKSQICAIVWNPHDKELITSHGFSQNQLTVWKYPSLARMAELKGHTSRILHMALSPDGQTVVSAAADETLRFWKVFNAETPKSRSRKIGKGELPSSSRSLLRSANIR